MHTLIIGGLKYRKPAMGKMDDEINLDLERKLLL